MSVKEFLAAKAAKVDQALETYVTSWGEAPATLLAAIRYSLFAGGKRLRPALALGAAEIVSGDDAVALPAACAIEMIHTYSLIHDDLPAMDDDHLRRGKPTLHHVHDEGIAILAGDGLLTMAFDVVAHTEHAGVVAEIARAAGVEGMVGGQVIDMESEGRTLTIEALRRLHSRKTGALIRVSVRSGAILAGADAECLDALTRYGEHIGLAFQIADDILDVVGSEATLGKPVGSDAANHKSTYPRLVGLVSARDLAEKAVADAVQALQLFGDEADVFRALARFVIERDT
ncbi:MAG TPA: polyprenyl synthetase family protein [Candidatus Hydrogenedentes bacterium]|nr:polyprenyl synthetase family protein [Candidatus Hydrogenedentota bacterium]HIJ73714.1 polyprenyl synthetase family protein [Candidatus Hydrogenedentota bacterium]